MKIEVYVGNGYVKTIEVKTQDDIDSVVWETVKNWAENTYYWMPAEED